MHSKPIIKELFTYCVFGFLTFIVSMVTFYICNSMLGLGEHTANIISWIIAVEFAFVTNRRWVFSAEINGVRDYFKKMSSFFSGRLLSLLVEEIIIFIFITILHYPSLGIKCIAQIVVIILNYIISKIFVFKKKNNSA